MNGKEDRGFFSGVEDFFSSASGAASGIGSVFKNAPYFIGAGLMIAGIIALAQVKTAFKK